MQRFYVFRFLKKFCNGVPCQSRDPREMNPIGGWGIMRNSGRVVGGGERGS